MLLKGLVLAVSAIIVVVAIIGYSPLPAEIEDPVKTQILMSIIKLSRAMYTLTEFLGYGPALIQMKSAHKPPTEEAPASASYGELKVTREEVAGVPVIIYRPKEGPGPHPGIVFFHGGGWVLGNPDLYDKIVYEYALQTSTTIFSVDYRMAPDHPFPAPVHDCLAVTRFVLRHGDRYNVDVTRVGVAGDSAGGNLAAAVALQLTREKSDLPPLLFQVMHYPAVQAFDFRLPSYIDHNHSLPILSHGFMCELYAAYLGLDMENLDYYKVVLLENRHIPAHVRKSKYAEFVDVKLLPAQYQKPKNPAPAVAPGHDEKVYTKIKDIVTNPLFSPLMSPDLSGLPPAFVHIAEFDVLRDDGFLYARRLLSAGVKTVVHFGAGGYHGDASFAGYFQSNSGKTALSAAYNFIRNLLEK